MKILIFSLLFWSQCCFAVVCTNTMPNGPANVDSQGYDIETQQPHGACDYIGDVDNE